MDVFFKSCHVNIESSSMSNSALFTYFQIGDSKCEKLVYPTLGYGFITYVAFLSFILKTQSVPVFNGRNCAATPCKDKCA